MRWPLVASLLLAGCRPPAPAAVVVAYPQGPESLVPDQNNDEYTSSVLGNVFEPLVSLDGDLVTRPALAESWTTPDDHTWTFRLRPGVRLHDGRRLTAAAVVASLDRTRLAPESKRRAELAVVTSIDAPDERTVVVRTRVPFAPLPNRLAGVPIGVASGTSADAPPVGTGPYHVVRWTPRGETVLESFPEYRGGAPAIRTLTFRVVPDDDRRLELLLSGAVHLVGDVSPEAAHRIREEATLRIVQRRGLLVTFLVVDCGRDKSPYVSTARNPFRDVRVRRALALAIDRAALVDGPLAGRAEAADQIVGPEVFGHRPGLAPWPFDPTAARRLLSEAGYGGGFAFDLDVLDSDVGRDAAAALARDLEAVHLHLRPRFMDLASLVRRVEARDTSSYLMPWIGTSGDAGSSYEYLLHTPAEKGLGIDNGGGYSNPQLDELLEAASQRLRPAERRAMLMSVASLVREDAPVVPLYRRLDVYAVARDLEFRPRLDREIHGADMRWSR